MSFLIHVLNSPWLPLLVIFFARVLVQRLERRSPLYERFTAGLRVYPAPSVAEIDELLAARGRGGVGADARRVVALLDARSQGALLPWRHEVLRSDFSSLAWFAAFLTAALMLSSALECARGPGGPGSPHATLAVLAACGVAASGLLRAPLLLGGAAAETRLALGFGAVAGVAASGAAYALVLASPPSLAAFASPGEGLVPGSVVGGGHLPALDLGASLRFALPGRAAMVGGALGVGIAVGAATALLFAPALRLAKHYHESVRAAGSSSRPRLTKALHRLWFYAPLLVALAWWRSFASDTLLPHDAVRCSTSAPSRDCRVGLGAEWLPGHGEGPDALRGVLAALVPAPLVSLLPFGSLPATAWLGESAWLRLRCVAVLLVAALHFSLARPALQRFLDAARDEQEQALTVAIAEGPPKGGAAAAGERSAYASGFPEAALVKLAVACDAAVARGNIGATLGALVLTAAPMLLAGIVLLELRLGGLDNFGVCAALRAATGMGDILPPATPKADAWSAVFAIAGPVAAERASALLASATSPALWRPLLSLVLLGVLLAHWIELELALLYWRVFADEPQSAADTQQTPPEVATRTAPATEAEPFATLKGSKKRS